MIQYIRMAQRTIQMMHYTTRTIFSVNSGAKCENFTCLVLNLWRPFSRNMSYSSLRGLRFNLHSSGLFPLVKSWPIWKVLGLTFSKLTLVSMLYGRQLNAIVAQRVRRTAQIINLYNNLGYDRRMVRNIAEKLGGGNPRKLLGRPIGLLLGAAFFSWEKERISEEELTEVADEISEIQRIKVGDNSSHFTDWEKVIDKGYLTLWRKPVPNSYLYEYKVYGSFHDLPARAFFAVQVDLEFRKQWDKLVIDLDVVDREDETGSEVVHWIMHYPYPMYSREYLYIRKHRIDHEKKLMVIINRSVDHPCRPVNNKFVRVNTYMSEMVIKPHNTFDENGFDYVLTYYDDPKSAFPSVAYSWMANTGVPDFVEKLHKAAMLLNERKKGLHKDEQNEDKDRIPM